MNPLPPPPLLPPPPALKPPAGYVQTSRPGLQRSWATGAGTLQPPPALMPPPLMPPGTQRHDTAPQPRPVPSNNTTSHGDDWVQVVLLEGPNDAYARVEFVAAGVNLHPASLVPKHGAIHILTATTGACVYRWRC